MEAKPGPRVKVMKAMKAKAKKPKRRSGSHKSRVGEGRSGPSGRRQEGRGWEAAVREALAEVA